MNMSRPQLPLLSLTYPSLYARACTCTGDILYSDSWEEGRKVYVGNDGTRHGANGAGHDSPQSQVGAHHIYEEGASRFNRGGGLQNTGPHDVQKVAHVSRAAIAIYGAACGRPG